MSEKKFLTEEELTQLKNFKTQQGQIALALGENRLQKENILSSYRMIAAQEQEFYKNLSIKYGDGSLDLSTGEIKPLESQVSNEQDL